MIGGICIAQAFLQIILSSLLFWTGSPGFTEVTTTCTTTSILHQAITLVTHYLATVAMLGCMVIVLREIRATRRVKGRVWSLTPTVLCMYPAFQDRFIDQKVIDRRRCSVNMVIFGTLFLVTKTIAAVFWIAPQLPWSRNLVIFWVISSVGNGVFFAVRLRKFQKFVLNHLRRIFVRLRIPVYF